MTLQEFVVKLGFDVDENDLSKVKKGLKTTQDATKKVATEINKAAKAAKDGTTKIGNSFSNLGNKVKGIGNNIKGSLKGLFSFNWKTFAFGGIAVVALKKFTQGISNLIKDFNELNRETYATDQSLAILGKTLDEVNADPKLLAQFNELKDTFDSLDLPPALTEASSLLNDITTSVSKLKAMFNVFLKWVGYSILNNLQKPLSDAKDALDKLGNWFKNNMRAVADVIGKVLGKVVKVFSSAFKAIGKVIDIVRKIIDKLPDGIAEIGVAVFALFKLFKGNPVIAVLTVILLLIDDFITYLEGGESALAGLWDAAMPIFKAIEQWIYDVVDAIRRLWNNIKESGALDILFETAKTVLTFIIDNVKKIIDRFTDLWGRVNEGEGIFNKIADVVGALIVNIIDLVAGVIDLVTWFFNLEPVQAIFETIGDIISNVVLVAINLVIDAIDIVQGIIEVIAKLVKGDFKGAFEAAGETINKIFGGVATLLGGIKDTIGGIVGGVKNIASTAWNGVTGFFGGGHAEGGIFNQPHIAPFAEGGYAEAVIPLEGPNKKKGAKIFNQIKDVFDSGMGMARDARNATAAYNQVTNENKTINNVNNNPRIEVTIPVTLPQGMQMTQNNLQKVGQTIGQGLQPYLQGIYQDNLQGVYA